MKIINKKLISVLTVVAACFLVFIFCSCSVISGNGKIKVTDLSGRTITLDGPAQRIAALSAADCEIIYALGAGDKIVARGTYCDYPESVKNIKDVGSGELTNMEELIAAQPDVVLMSKTGFTLDQVNAMEKAGLKTLVNEANTFEDTFKYIDQLGKVVGKQDEAEILIGNMKYACDDFIAKCADYPSKSIYFQLCQPQYGYWTAGKNTFLSEMATILNCSNIFDDLDGWVEVSNEQITARHPDITINIDDDESFTRPGPRLINALDKMYHIIYGD